MSFRAGHTAVHRVPRHRERRPPGPLLLLLEGRAPWEFAAMQMARPWMDRLPAGDGHPVIVLPGLAANDWSTLPMRRFLRRRGYDPHPWRQGFNRWLAESYRGRISLIGWSLGGVFAREIAKEIPELVRCVITLGSPFSGHPEATNAWRLFEMVSGQSVHDEATLAGIRQPPPVPTTSIYSRTDGVVAWH
jgi:pimeloyl-ACP methyl ester carboxylesterase